jgi:thiol-disulfide isomerase/thioredoxin
MRVVRVMRGRWSAPVCVTALVLSAASVSGQGASPSRTTTPHPLAALERDVLAARDSADLARARDTADGDARLRHPVRIARWLSAWRTTTDAARRQALAAAVLLNADTLQLDSATARTIGATLDPTSAAWALRYAHYADAVGASLRLASARRLSAERAGANEAFRVRWMSALDSVIARTDAHPAARFATLVRAARVRGRREGVREAAPYLALLTREFPREHDTEITLAAYGAERVTRVGRVAPDFRVRSLDGRRIITRDSLAGRVVLLDVWATWCAPCIAEMPVIARAYARHHAAGFDVLSVSMDTHAGLVARFRAARYPMPWQHAFATLLDDLPVVFGITQVPRAILLGRDGTILALDDELRGDALEETVRAALARPR